MTGDGKTPSDRHLSTASFEEFLRQGVPIEYPIPGEPRLTAFIDPVRPAIGLHVPKRYNESTPDTGLQNIRVHEVHSDGTRRFEVVVTDRRLFADAYPVLLSIADRLQLDGRSLDAALSDTMRILGRLLARQESLPPDRELGLFGELLFLAGLMATTGAVEAIASWRGPYGEEHDFGLRGLDVEVKATSSERRTHWIGSLGQLVPVDDRPLWLVSYQLTRAGIDDGKTLPDLIATVRDGFDTYNSSIAFEECLQRMGWDKAYQDTSRSRWRIRNGPVAFAVAEGFPRLTPDLLHRADIDLSRVLDVRYRLDLTDLPHGTEMPELLGAVLVNGGKNE